MGNQQAKPSSPSTTTNHSPITKALQQRYLENFSTIHRAMGETQDLHDCYINLALIKESKEEEKKQLSERGAGKEHGTGEEKGMRDELLSSFESIHSKKEALALENLFRRMPDDAEEPEKILILGRAGIGKTILASYLAHEWALADTKLPPLNTTSTAHSGGGSSSSRGPSSMRPSSVAKGPNPALLNELKRFDAVFFIPLRGLINEVDLSLSGVIRKHCLGDIEELRPSIAEIIDYLRTVQNNCLWILDGYDEVEQWIRESANPKPWENFLQGVFSCRHVIMTSRPHAVPPNTGIVTINIAGLSCRFNRALENVGFTNENIEAYVRKILPRQAGEAKLAKLKSNPNIWGIAHIPINLDILCSTEVEANTMSQLYQQLVKVFLDRFKKTADGQKHVYNISLIIKALKKLAYVAMAKSQILLDPALQKEALPLSEFPPNILDDMLQTGLLKRSADRSVYFIHLTFQEFFAAEFLATKFIENKQGLAPTFLPASATTTPTASGSSNTSASNSIAAFPQTAAEFIAKEKYNSRCEVVLWFLAGILYQPQETSQDATALWRFFNIIESHPRDLIGMHHVSLLVRLLDECEGGEKLAFYEELMGNVMPCLEVWGNSNFPREVPMQRSLAASALIQRGHKMTNFWLQFLAKPAIKQSAIQSLGDIGLLVDSSIISALLQDLRDKDSWYVRASAAGALGKLGQGGNQAVIDALLQALRDTVNDVRASAAGALGKLGQGGNQAVIDALLQALRDTDNDVRARVAEALVKLGQGGNQAVIDALLQALRDTVNDVRASAAEALVKLGQGGNQAVIDALLQALRDTDDDVRASAAEALGKLGQGGNQAVIDALLQALRDKDSWYVRARAAEALVKLGQGGNQAVIDALLQALRDTDNDVRARAAEALGKLGQGGNQAVIDALLQALRNTDNYVRARAAEALVKLGQGGNQAVIDALLQALRNTNNYVRARAAEALVKLGQGGNQAVIDALLQALRDKEYYVRASAAEALGKFSPNIVLSLLSNPAAISQIKASAQALQLPVIVYDAYLSQCPFGLRTLLPAPATPTSSTATTSSAPTSTPESLVTLQTVAHGISKLQQGQEKIQSQLEQVEKVNVEVKKEVGSVGIQTRMLNVKTDLSLDLQNNREAAAVATLLNPVIVPEEDLPVLTSVSNLSSTLSSVGVFATTSSAPTSTPSTQSNTESSFSTTSSMSKT